MIFRDETSQERQTEVISSSRSKFRVLSTFSWCSVGSYPISGKAVSTVTAQTRDASTAPIGFRYIYLGVLFLCSGGCLRCCVHESAIVLN